MADRNRLFDLRVSGFPEAIGICNTDMPRIAAAANEAQQRLLTDPMAPDEGWFGGYAQYAFTATPPYQFLVCPREVARIISLTACKQPMKLRNQFFEFLDFGIGNQPTGCNSNRCGQQFQAYERDTVPTINTFVAGSIIRAYPLNADDVGKRSLIQGTDSNGLTIYSTSVLTGKPILGETISLDIPFVDTVNAFNTVTAIQKYPTDGDVVYYQVDPVTAVETPLTAMQATEQTAQYRRYFLNGLRNTCCGSSTSQQVLALCKLDFIPAQSDQDYLLIQSIPALIEEGMAVRYSRMDTPGSQSMAQAKHARALQLLFGQLDHFLGKFQTAITVPIFGSDRLRPQFQ